MSFGCFAFDFVVKHYCFDFVRLVAISGFRSFVGSLARFDKVVHSGPVQIFKQNLESCVVCRLKM